MKKIFKLLLILCCAFCTIPVSACSSDKSGMVTGAACSIKELSNLEKQKNKVDVLQSEKNLRPVRIDSKANKKQSRCIFEPCLYSSLIEKQ